MFTARAFSGSFRSVVQLRRSMRPLGPAGSSSIWLSWIKPRAKKGLKLFWFSTGKDDFVMNTTKATVELFQKHGYQPLFQRKRRRSYLDQLARVLEPVRSAIVPIAPATHSDTIQVYVSRTGAHRHCVARSQAAGRMVRAEAGFSH